MAGLVVAGGHMLHMRCMTPIQRVQNAAPAKLTLSCAVFQKLASLVQEDGKLAQPKRRDWHCVGFFLLGSDAKNVFSKGKTHG